MSEECRECNGKGEVRCPECHGTSRVDDDLCPVCCPSGLMNALTNVVFLGIDHFIEYGKVECESCGGTGEWD